MRRIDHHLNTIIFQRSGKQKVQAGRPIISILLTPAPADRTYSILYLTVFLCHILFLGDITYYDILYSV
jgi:hypothetical protein